MQYPKTTIVMPAYNEEKRIGKTLEIYSSFFESLRQKSLVDYEILVVINNTKDKTAEVVNQFRKKNSRINFINLVKGGKGYAVIEGFKESLKGKSEYIGFVDADLATPPESFYHLITSMKNHDGMMASRYLEESELHPPMNFRRAIVGKIFNLLVRSVFLFTYRDTQCGAKLFRRKVLEKIVPHLGFSGWAFDVELLYEAKKSGFNLKDVPTIWYEVPGSKLRVVKTSLQMFFAVVQLRAIKSPFRILLKPLKSLIVPLWRKIND